MRVFLDMEFTGLTQTAQPVSIGMVSESDQHFYGEFTDFDPNLADEWVRQNVFSKLWIYKPNQARIIPANLTYRTGTRFQMAVAIAAWLGQFWRPPAAIEIWADVYAYDWVLFCELYGGAFEVPEMISYIPFDLATAFKIRGVDPDVDRDVYAGTKGSSELSTHNALHDAIIIRACYDKLMAEPEGYVGRMIKREEN